MGVVQSKLGSNTIYCYFPSMINTPSRLVGNRSKRMSHQPASAYKTVVFFGTRLRREIPDHTLWSYHDSTL